MTVTDNQKWSYGRENVNIAISGYRTVNQSVNVAIAWTPSSSPWWKTTNMPLEF